MTTEMNVTALNVGSEMKYKLGDTLYCVYGSHKRREPESVTIEKVGRKWLYLSNGYRADIDTLILDGNEFASPGECWGSESNYNYHRALEYRWKTIFNAVYAKRPSHLTMEDMDEICRLLKI